MPLPRRAFVIIEYNGRDITQEVSSTLLNFIYTDRASNEADEIQLNCHDRENRWISTWYPKVRVDGGR